MFHAFCADGALKIIHAASDLSSYTTDGKPFASMALENLSSLLAKHGALHFVAADVPNRITDVELLSRMRFAYQDSNGVFLDAGTDESITQVEASPTVAIMSAFHSPQSNLNLVFFHYPFASVKYAEPIHGESFSVETALENESIKQKVFPMTFTKGVRRVIDGHFVFCENESIVIQLVATHYLGIAQQSELEKLFRIDTDLPRSFSAEEGTLTLDLSAVPSGASRPLSIEIKAHDFLHRWIYEEQRFSSEFLLYRM